MVDDHLVVLCLQYAELLTVETERDLRLAGMSADYFLKETYVILNFDSCLLSNDFC